MTTSPNEPVDNDESGTPSNEASPREHSSSNETSDTGGLGIDDGQLPEDLQPGDDNPLADPEGNPVGQSAGDPDDPADQPTNDPTGGTPL